MTIERLFSGVRPTGGIHLGNYLGAIRHWVSLQKQAQQSLFCIVDLHALTTITETESLVDTTRCVAAAYLAAGIDPNRASIFVQSHVSGHAELAWVLGCITPLGWLNRMTQFKEKSGKNKETSHLGLYAYPVLMAADILLYQATHVPVGEDQKQHLELARDIAESFNHRFGHNILSVPEPMILGEATRVMSLRNGLEKMSKSDLSDYSRIHLMDDIDTIRLKIRKAKSDAGVIPESADQLTDRPEAKNLVTIYAALSDTTSEAVCQQFAGSTFSIFKDALSDLLLEEIVPIGTEMQRYLQDPHQIDCILKQGGEVARDISQQHLQAIKEAIQLLTL